jgi:hypothetical protein
MTKKLLDQVRDALRIKHYSYRTEEAYVDWFRRFSPFPRETPPPRKWAAPRSKPSSPTSPSMHTSLHLPKSWLLQEQ